MEDSLPGELLGNFQAVGYLRGRSVDRFQDRLLESRQALQTGDDDLDVRLGHPASSRIFPAWDKVFGADLGRAGATIG